MMFLPILILCYTDGLKSDDLINCKNVEDKNCFVKEGKIMVGFVDSSSNKTRAHQMQNILTFQRTIEEFADPIFGGEAEGEDIGYVMILTKKTDIVQNILSVLHSFPNIVAFIGPRISVHVLSLASLLSSFRIPTFVYGSSILSDYILESLSFKYVLPMTATATGQANIALPRLLESIGADIVTVVYDDSDYARPQLPILLKSLKSNEIDVRNSFMLTVTSGGARVVSEAMKEGLRNDLNEAQNSNRTLVISALVFYKGLSTLIKGLMEEKLKGTDKKLDILLVTSSQGCTLAVKDEWRNAGIHVIKMCQTYSNITDLENYFNNTAFLWHGQNSSLVYNKLLVERVTRDGRCPTGNNTCFRNLLLENAAAGRPYSSYNHRIYYAVRTLLLALASPELKSDLLNHSKRDDGLKPFNATLSDSIVRLFKKNSGKFKSGLHFGENQNRSVPYLNIGVILNNKSAVDWREEDYPHAYRPSLSNLSLKRIKCSLPCDPGHYMFKDPQQQAKNCWQCPPCLGNTYSNITNAAECTSCAERTWSNPSNTSCSGETTSLDLIDHPYGSIVLALVLIFFAITIITFVFYLGLWNSRVIIASGRDLATFMFPGMLCGLLTASLIASPPGNVVCTSVQVLSHLFVILIVPPLFVRTLRILIVFNFSVTKKTVVRYVTKHYVYAHMIVVMIPVLVSLLYGLHEPSYRFEKHPTEEGYLNGVYKITASCAPKQFTLVYVLIAYVITVLLLATTMGFKTRRLPENYKESLHIFMCSLVTLALVLCYVPAMILIPGERQVFSLSVIVAVLSATVNATIFLPKIYMCMKYPELRRRKPTPSPSKTLSNRVSSPVHYKKSSNL